MSHMTSILLANTAPMIGHLQAYDNDLTAIIPDLYEGLDLVSRELVGFIPSVFRDSNAERAAVGQSVVYTTPTKGTGFNVTPAMVTPEPGDFEVDTGSLTISKAKGYNFGWTGEQQRSVATSVGYVSIQASMFAEALRDLVNEIEVDVATEAYKSASRAIGTAGTTPFASNFDEVADIRKILDDNGAPMGERSLVFNTAAGANLRKKTQLTKANEAGTTMTLRQGELLDIHGFSLKESAGVQTHTKGTGTSYQLSAAAAVGATTLSVDTGSGTIKKGDVVTLAGDTNKYVAAADLAGGVLQIAKPGLRVAAADNTVITVGNNFTGNVALTRRSVHLITRAPALPNGGDSAIDSMMLTDPRSGLSFEVRLYAGYRKIRAEVTSAWGVGAVKPEDIALLLG